MPHPSHSRLVAVATAALVGSAAIATPSPARADANASLALLSFLGAAPAFATDQLSFGFGLGAPPLGGITTTAFAGLPGAPGSVTYGTWSVSPGLMMNGRWAAAQVAFDLHFGGDDALGDGLVADHTFGFRLMYHSGFNVLGFLDGLAGEVALSVGPMVNVGIGPFWTLRGADREAEYGHIGLIQLAPSLAASVITDPFSAGIMVGYVPGGGLPWNFVEATLGDGSGAWDHGVIDPDPQTQAEAFRSLGSIETRDAWLLSASAAVHFYRADEPFLTLGARLTWRRHDYQLARGDYAGPSTFHEEELRFILTLGIGAPAGYDWTGGS